MRGDFRAILLAKSLPYTNERPGGPLVARPVSECKSSKKCGGGFLVDGDYNFFNKDIKSEIR